VQLGNVVALPTMTVHLVWFTTISNFAHIIVMDNDSAMDVDDICDNNVSHEDEIHGSREDVNGNNSEHMVEDHVPAPSEVNVLCQQVSRGKNKSIDGDHRVEKCARECDLDPKKSLSLDVATRWNSTYIMVRDAIYYKNAFDRLAKKEKDRYGHINPSANDWLNALNISKCLKKFYDVTLLFSGTSYPTANHFFRKFSEIKMAIARWCDSSDPIICTMAYSMRDKFDKYWEMNNMALAVGAFLDPRYKHRMVELYMSKMYDSEMADLEKMAFMNVINELFSCYSSTINAKSTKKGTSSKDFVPNKQVLMADDDENEVDLDELYAATDNEKKVSELDLYMSEGLVKANESDAPFNALSWWKGQVTNFPILSTLARDVLSMQVSTVASESAFSSGGRVVDAFRSKLKPEIIEALVCTKDWKIASEKGFILLCMCSCISL
jgi:hypothetical protein